MLIKKSYKVSLALITALSLAGCGATEEDEVSTTSVGTTAGTTSADSLDDLKISDALALTLPAALGGDSSSGLRLQSNSKSAEACEVGQLLKEGIRSLGDISSTFCHLEVESENIKFGTKYSITFSGLSEDDQDQGMNLGIWVDNSKADQGELKVSMCEDGSLTQVFTVTGVDTDGAKGTILNIGSEEWEGQEQSWASNVSFDLNYTDANRSFVNVKSVFTSDNDLYRQHIVIDLIGDGVSNLRVSRSGTWESNTFSQMGAAKHNGDYGQVLFSNIFSGSDPEGNDIDFNFTHRAYFDDDGYIVQSDTTDAFAEGGALYVADSDVPKKLESTFTAGEFGSDEWDCTAEEEVTVVMSGENGSAHSSCDQERDEEWVDCYADTYQSSEEEHEIDEAEQKDNTEFDEIEEVSDETPAAE